MAKFQKKPAFFEAFQFGGFHATPWPDGVDWESGEACYVVTAHGQRVYLSPGDWVVAEPNGNGYYPIKDSIMPTIADKVEG